MGRLLKSLCSGCLFVIVAASVLLTSIATACETPVYRYAMYRWQPAPYEVYFFHDQPANEQDQRVQEMLTEYERGDDARANVACIPVNIAEDPELTSVPPDVKKAWLEREDKQLPCYFISTPYGAGISFEQLDEAKVKSLVESPARKSLAAQLETGKLGVFVMLGGKDEAENEATAAILNGLVEEVREGKVSLYVSPTDAPAEGEPAAPKSNFDLGFIQINRDDPEEQWLVRSLLAMEPDLPNEERPMIFLVYGRARALLPYIGKGITRENLIREIEFISGACSCTVKEQNPGIDLLVRYDWDSAAAALAEKFGNEEGNESQFGPEMFFPELIIPDSGSPVGTEVAATENAEPVTDNTIIEQTAENVDPDTSPNKDDNNNVVEATATLVDPEFTATPTGPQVATVAPALAPLASSTIDGSSSSSLTSVWIVGAGVGVALLVLFGLTFVVLRPR
ncbi:MAG: hypothetical protein O3C40_18615 [Planctomycetota bacterium]|nr:hypothetical protein [Planctomycetota bacterium]